MAVAALAIAASAQTLEDGFKSPPPSAKPQTWCHLMNGNVTKDGITRDFEEIAKVGLGDDILYGLLGPVRVSP